MSEELRLELERLRKRVSDIEAECGVAPAQQGSSGVQPGSSWRQLLELQSEGSLDGFLLVDNERIVSYNRHLAELWGLPDGTLVAPTVQAAAEQAAKVVADPERFLANLGRALSQPDLVVETELKDGRILERRGAVLKDDQGNPAANLFLFRDITAEKQASLELQAFVRRQAAMARLGGLALRDASPDDLMDEMVILVAEALDVPICELLEVDGECGELLLRAAAGLPPEVVGRARASRGRESQAGFTLLSNQPVVVESLEAETRFRPGPLLVAAGAVSGITVAIPGKERPFGVLGAHQRKPRRFARDEIGFLESVAGLLAVWIERRRSNTALRSSEASFRALIEKSPDLVGVYRDGRYIYANPALAKALGYASAAEIAGRTVEEFVHVDDRSRLRQLIYTDWNGGPIEVRLVRRDGGLAQVEWVGLPIDFEGQPARLGLGRDLTERRQMQVRLLLADRLASVGTLAAGVAHELNNPLAYIIANLSFLDKELQSLDHRPEGAGSGDAASPAEMRQAVQEASEGAMRMRLIVQDLRTFSRDDDASRELFDVRRVLESSVNLAWNEIRHRARLIRDLQAVPPIMGNESRIGQVFLNLLINAAQAIPEGAAGENEIRVATRLHTDGRVAIEVSDSGGGISPDAMSRIFDPFFTTKPVGIGTGLGLWICHNIVHAHRGEIDVDSRLGEGSLFRVLLPAAWSEVSDGAREDGPEPRRGRVLVVDDEPLVGSVIRRGLAADHEVTVVSSAAAALDLLRSGAGFDALVCDLQMPDMSGPELRQQLHALQPDLARRVVFTAGLQICSAARSGPGEPVVCLDKPLDGEQLRQEVRRLVEQG